MKFSPEKSNSNECDGSIDRMVKLLEKKVADEDFLLEDGESSKDVLSRVELLRAVLYGLPLIADNIISTYRAVLEEYGIGEDRTGRLSLVVVGGRVHGESELKTWSDVDTIITAEKPFLSTRSVFLTKAEEAVLPEPLTRSADMKRLMKDRFLSEIIPKFGEIVGTDLANAGILELKGYGDQRNEDVKEGLVIYSEKF